MLKKYILGAINICLLVILFTILFFGLTKISIFSKKIETIILISFLIFIVISIGLYLSKKSTPYNIGAFLTLLLNIIFAFEIYSLNNTYSFIENIKSNKYIYPSYEVYVQKSNTKYNNLSKLKNKKLGMLKTNRDNIKEFINTKVKIEYIEYNNIDELCEGIQTGEVQAFIIEDTDKKELENHDSSIKYRVILETRIKKLK